MNLRRSAIVILWASAAFFGSSADSADIYNNLTQPVSVDGPFSTSLFPALSFRTTGINNILDSVTIPIRNPNSLSTGSINFQLYDATGTGNGPGAALGAALGSVPISGISSASYQSVTFSGLNRTLSTSTNYYVVIQAVGLTNTYNVGATTSTNGNIIGSLGYSISNNSGNSWSAPSNSLFIIGQVTAVPEPSTYVLCGLGVAAMALTARRKTKKAMA
jgi:hypothetical protein